MTIWKLIESAPRDGTPVLLYGPRLVYHRDYWMPDDLSIAVGCWDASDYGRAGHWVTDVGNDSGYDGGREPADCLPTHWAEIPVTPTLKD